MPFDLTQISEAQNKALALTDEIGRRRLLEDFVEVCRPLLEVAVCNTLQELLEDINTQLATMARLRLVQEGSRLVPQIVATGDEAGSTGMSPPKVDPTPRSPNPHTPTEVDPISWTE